MTSKFTTVAMLHTTKQKLNSLKLYKHETYEDVITRLIEGVEKSGKR